MKLSDFLFNVGRPVAFYPGLVKALGSMKQAVFICQMAYWKDKGSDPEGWIYKTSDEIETETSLTYKEQITVRSALVARNALEEHYARTEHKMYFRVNWDTVNNLWQEHLTNGHMPNGQVAVDQRSGGILPTVISLNSNTDTTQKNTAHGADAPERGMISPNTGRRTDAVVKGDSLDGMLEYAEQAQQAAAATDAFEKAFGVQGWPWTTKTAWRKFADWVLSIYKADPGSFEAYAKWREDGGKYGKAMSNNAIRRDPEAFRDTGWPTFLADSEFRRSEEKVPNYYLPYVPKENHVQVTAEYIDAHPPRVKLPPPQRKLK